MAIHDRRTGGERRSLDRYTVDIPVEWESANSERHNAALSDISIEGCFVLSSGEVKNDDVVRIFIPLGDGMKVQFDGKVANYVFEIGFGVKFEPLSPAQQELLTNLLKKSGHA
ncbi:MAG: PilZ domain-containing protein [Pyrinomonadaceae bacterium]